MFLNVNDLSRNPTVDALSSFFRWLNNDARDGALHVLINQSTGIDAQAAIDILKIDINQKFEQCVCAVRVQLTLM